MRVEDGAHPHTTNRGTRTVTITMFTKFLGLLALATAMIAAPAASWAQPRPAPAPAATPQTPPARPTAAAPLATPSGLPNLTFDDIMGETGHGPTVNVGAIAAGAVVGVVAFNVLGAYLFPGTYAHGGPLVGTAIADSALAASRIYAVSSAVAGGYIAYWLGSR